MTQEMFLKPCQLLRPHDRDFGGKEALANVRHSISPNRKNYSELLKPGAPFHTRTQEALQKMLEGAR